MKDININKYIGMPWLDGGRDVDGFDCWGLFAYVYEHEFNIKFKEQYHFLPGVDTKDIVKSFKKAISQGNWVKLDTPEYGCAVAMSMNKNIHHVGIWMGGGCMHAVRGVGVVYNNLMHLKNNGYNKVEFYKWVKKKKKVQK